MKEIFNYTLHSNSLIFSDTITSLSPYVAKAPRNHESLFFVTNGKGIYEKNNLETIISTGQVGYISRGSIDKTSAYDNNNFSYIAINFNFDNKSEPLKPSLPFNIVCGLQTTLYENLFIKVLNVFLNKKPGYMTICNGLVLQIIGCLYEEIHISSFDMKKYKNIENAIELIKCNYNDSSLRIESLASICNMSERNIRRIFLDLYNQTPYMYLQNFRINKAKILLQHTSKSINEIGEECGFSDIYSFSHCFKKFLKVSPLKYRNNNIY